MCYSYSLLENNGHLFLQQKDSTQTHAGYTTPIINHVVTVKSEINNIQVAIK